MTLNDGNSMDWQGNMGTIQERMKYLLDNGLNADVEFLVGTGIKLANGKEEKQLFRAHKLILASSSSIFGAQFHFDGSTFSGQDNNVPIEVKDISASAFNAILNFLYTNDISLINKENIVGVYSAAKKYLLYALVQKCIEMAKTMLDGKNVFDMLKMAKLHDEEILISHCWAIIDDIDNLDDEEFNELSREEMGEILGRDSLRPMDEYNLFAYLYNWAVKQWQNVGIEEPNEQQLRAAMGALLKLIRFPLFQPGQFINYIVPLGILNNAEIAAILLHYAENADPNVKAHHPLPFSAQPRAIPPRPHNKLVDKFVTERDKFVLSNKLDLANMHLRASGLNPIE